MHGRGLTDADRGQLTTDDSPEIQMCAHERAFLLLLCIRCLRTRQAQIINMRYWRGMTFQAIADEFGVGPGAVHAMHRRALAALRRLLAESGIASSKEL